MEAGPGRRSRRGTVLVLVAVVLLALLAVAAAAGGAAELGAPRLSTPFSGAGERLGDLSDIGGQDPPSSQEDGPDPDDDRTPWALIIVMVLGAALALVVVRTLRPHQDDVRHEHRDDTEQPQLLDDGEDALTALRRAARRAGGDVAGAGPDQAGDAVIAAWLALERAASAGGAGRHPSQTPTEFTVDLLRVLHADVGATDELLHLYHRARFGHGGLPADAGDRAGAALDAIAASLQGARRG